MAYIKNIHMICNIRYPSQVLRSTNKTNYQHNIFFPL